VLEKLKINNNAKQIGTEFARIDNRRSNEQIELQELKVQEGRVPNVIGMGAKDAIFALEKSGLRVSFTGKGQVVSQSVTPGQNVARGQAISIVLR